MLNSLFWSMGGGGLLWVQLCTLISYMGSVDSDEGGGEFLKTVGLGLVNFQSLKLYIGFTG